jgi:hypothetical protein
MLRKTTLSTPCCYNFTHLDCSHDLIKSSGRTPGTQKHSIYSSKISKNAKIHQNIYLHKMKSTYVPSMDNTLYHSPPILYLKKSLLNLPPVALQI